MSAKPQTYKNIFIFITLSVLFYLVGYWLIFRLQKATPLMMSVGFAAIVTCWICNIKISDLGWKWFRHKEQILSYLIPLGVISVAYGLIWILGFGGFYNEGYAGDLRENYSLANWPDTALLGFHFLITATITFALTLPSVLGEEFAWRGFLVQQLSEIASPQMTALISGALWTAFHFPLIFLGLYGVEGSPLLYQLFCFSLYIMSASVIMTYLRLKTGSLWTAVIFHMSSNVFIQKFYAKVTLENDYTVWMGDEFGLIPGLVMLIVAAGFYRKLGMITR
ncbi:CPBP family intramembrane glutamic endopeptidase [Emcibacter sp.]|uniref:CPBP family intramembrane glutamic endopeptidase n=1 Tax=Emcibacter sp. TaxID=1979954 RepID=UPI002AA6A835|nr:CPBP family intramembrane glutamic endopeptidase [Emcibacter sp.]